MSDDKLDLSKLDELDAQISDIKKELLQDTLDAIEQSITAADLVLSKLEDTIDNLVTACGTISPEFIPPTLRTNIGYILAWTAKDDPEDMSCYLECDGTTIPTDPKYDALREFLGTTKTPNLQGIFLRGYGSQSVHDGFNTVEHKSGEVLVIQPQAVLKHMHEAVIGNWEGELLEYTKDLEYLQRGAVTYGAHEAPVDTENRPVNMAVRWLIRALL